MKLFKRKPPEPPWKLQYDALARFNTERERGVVHTPEYVQAMAAVQRDYNENYLPALHRIHGS